MLRQVGLTFERKEHNSMCDVNNITNFMQYLESKQIDIRPMISQPLTTLDVDKPLFQHLAIDVGQENDVLISECEGSFGLLEEAREISAEEKVEFMQGLVCTEKFPEEL